MIRLRAMRGSEAKMTVDDLLSLDEQSDEND